MRTYLTNLVNKINFNYLVRPDRGLITSLHSGGIITTTRRMVGEALAHVQGASLKANAAFYAESYHSPITRLVGICLVM